MTEIELSYLKKYGVDGRIGFNISSEDTEENAKIYKGFFHYAKSEHDNNFTLALRALLDNISADYKYELLLEKIVELEGNIQTLAEKSQRDIPKVEHSEGAEPHTISF